MIMRTVSQVTKLTGVSARTLQYYDEIGLLKPSELTEAGYRLYDDYALTQLQQILFYKELGFKLKEINEFISQPDFNQTAAFKKQKELFLLKRNRMDQLIRLLSRLEKGERVMSFKEFDLTEYINALEDFKRNRADEVVKNWGSVKNFDRFIQKIKEDEPEIAKLAIKQYGSIEKYTEAMKYNLAHFSEIMEQAMTGDNGEIAKKSDALYARLTDDRSKNAASDEIQSIVREMDLLFCSIASKEDMGREFWNSLIHTYATDYVKAITDAKYGKGAADYIVSAFQCYVKSKFEQKNPKL